MLVAIADSGVATGGEDFQCAPLAGEYDAVADVEGPGVAVDRLGHGTFVAGVIAECTDNGLGVVGLAPGARILAIRACTDDAECASSDVAASIDWAREHGARVINLSLGMACGTLDWPACSTEIENDAIARAKAAGMVIVAIAGNGGEDHIGFPANHPDVIGVGGVEERLLITSYSSWGTAPSLMAPAGSPASIAIMTASPTRFSRRLSAGSATSSSTISIAGGRGPRSRRRTSSRPWRSCSPAIRKRRATR